MSGHGGKRLGTGSLFLGVCTIPRKGGFFRVPVSSLNRTLRIRNPTGVNSEASEWLGVIDDIGPNGVGFTIDPMMHFRKFDVVRGSFETLAGSTIEFSLEVRSVRKVRNGSKVRVGGRYKNLSGRNSLRIQRELLHLQRMVRAQGSEEDELN